ncbi:MAG: hypothetical protein Q7U47_07965 [Paludibacter sp.]|nr:hypothetical protein [Paludibacter sp.]
MFSEHSLSSAIGEPFAEQNGLVYSATKVIRGKVAARYADRITGIYETGGKEIVNEKNIEALI